MKINVVVTTYNHAKYLAQCLEGILNQKGDFQMEVIIGDDASTDNTRQIAEQYQARYPGIIFVLPLMENLGSTKNLKRCLDACTGEYIAICEGDDYWTDVYKLQKQKIFLDQHKDFSMCFAPFLSLFEERGTFELYADPLYLPHDFITMEDLIDHNYIGNFSCCMYRRDTVSQVPDKLFEFLTVDLMFNMACGQLGRIGLIRDPMSVYRKHTHGAWAGQPSIENQLQLIDRYNEYFEYKYEPLFMRKKVQLQGSTARLQANPASETVDVNELIKWNQLMRIGLEEENKNLKLLISSMHNSSSWRITQPMRDLKTFTQKVFFHSRLLAGKAGNLIPRILPGVQSNKEQGNDALTQRPGQFTKHSSAKQYSEADPVRNQAGQSKHDEANPSLTLSHRPKKLPLLKKAGENYKINVVVTSYNHEKYISKCLNGILMQKGLFDIEVILGDDCSTDMTPQIMRDYQKKHPDVIKIMPNEVNLGVTQNIKRCLDACTGEFVAICEGDDYWISEEKLQKQMSFLIKHQEVPMCFSSIMLLYEPANKLVPHPGQYELNKDRISTEELIQTNYIGNFSCCMYRTDVIRELPPSLFDIYTVDWMFNIMCSEWGGIGYIRDWMSVYRLHSSGSWSGKSEREKYEAWLIHIDTYNKFLDFKYDAEFRKLKSHIENLIIKAGTR
jgi:glycosyltransferase involved in cell wall biosynthesis